MIQTGMQDLIHRLAEESDVTPGQAADNIDELIHRIKRRLRGGRAARLPGLGLFTPGRAMKFRAEESHASGSRSGGKARPPR